jgi:hypothetical protein
MGRWFRRYFYQMYFQLVTDIFLFLVSLICTAVVAITSHSGNGLKKTRGFQHLWLAMTMMENTSLTYNPFSLLIAVVSTCEFGFVIYRMSIKISTHFFHENDLSSVMRATIIHAWTMVHVNTMDTAQLCVHVPMTGPVVDVNVSFFTCSLWRHYNV